MIPGITDRNRLPRIGKIRLGEKRESKGGKEYPAALDHFSFVDCPEVEAIYGKECKGLYPVIFPSDDEEITFPTARKAYGTSGLICACRDGVTATRVCTGKQDEQLDAYCAEHQIQKPQEGEMVEMPCPGQDCPWSQHDLCKPIGRLMFMLEDVPKFGFYEICTTSFNSMQNVLGVLRSMKAIVGRVAGMRFALKLVPQQVQPKGEKAKTVHVLALEVRESLKGLVAAKHRLDASGDSTHLLDSVDDTPDDLMPQGGARLEDKLAGQATVAARLHNIVDAKVSEIGVDAPAGEAPKIQTITPAQAKALISAARDAGWKDTEIKAELAKEGWAKSTEIPASVYDVALKAFSQPRPAASSPAETEQGDPL